MDVLNRLPTATLAINLSRIVSSSKDLDGTSADCITSIWCPYYESPQKLARVLDSVFYTGPN